MPPPPLGLIAPFLCARSNLCVHFVWPYGSYVRDKSSPFFSPTHKIKGYLCEAATVPVGEGIKKEEKTILILSPVHPSTPDPGEQKGARVALLKSHLWADGVGGMGHIAKKVTLSHHQIDTSPKKLGVVTSTKIILLIPVTSPKKLGVVTLPNKGE